MILKETRLGPKQMDSYEEVVDVTNIREIKSIATALKRKKILHINATPVGGGVAEILASIVPLEVDLGLDAKWLYIEATNDFFEITKKIHNSVQGSGKLLSNEEKEYYLNVNEKIASNLLELNPDAIVVHDPQPLAGGAMTDFPKALRIHPDLSSPDSDTIDFLSPYAAKYDKLIFSLPEYVPSSLREENIMISPPAIDPLSTKNIALPIARAREILADLGLDTSKPIVTQVSRFDPWKDPVGVMEAVRIVQQKIPEIQLALVGIIITKDDPEQVKIVEEVIQKIDGTKNVHLYYKPEHMKSYDMSTFINAFQTGSDVILQKSIKEGFGLTVTEAMFKGTPVVGGNVGGIKLQIRDGVNGYLVNNAGEAADRIMELLTNRQLREEMGIAAKESVKQNYLMTRYLRDDLLILKDILKT